MLKAQIAKSSGMFIKVCGLTRSEEVAACLNMGIDATGFIFVPGSPREISQDEARALPNGYCLAHVPYQSKLKLCASQCQSQQPREQLHSFIHYHYQYV